MILRVGPWMVLYAEFIGRIIIADVAGHLQSAFASTSSLAMAHPGRLASLTLLISSFLLLFLFPSTTEATALTYNVHANEKACFYLWSDVPGKKVGFYFAVSYLSTRSNSSILLTDLNHRYNQVVHLISISQYKIHEKR